ncbi:MAG: enoyl-CoA hydratase-related protein [Halieaceae bacterium]|uniref:enoyl-CoA hydratase-related protein n=1 Tax=Haliea alexandrii TaxID=2448162 RepID=UPI000F0B7790|nr:enoyl-CoA hydratase-related protein [Haliea alexandrii]MCR9184199.1 enoyl-CoA hydratase-related protein [Halieaceae bacterium]
MESSPDRLPLTRDARLSLENGVAVLLLDRDDVRNALTGTHLLDDIVAVCDWINRTAKVGALVISGRGKAFSAGGNIKDMHQKKGMFAGDGLQIQDNYRRGIQTMTTRIYQLEVPVIAAVNGAAIGAGMDLSCMCDIRIGSQHARFGETFVNLGIIPGDGGAWFLPKLVGPQRAAELTFSGRLIDAEQALDYGLILQISPSEELLDSAVALAHTFASKPRHALRISKRLLQAGQRLPLQDFLDYCASQQSLCHASDQHLEALASVLNAQ